MESPAGAATEKDGARTTASKPATTPPSKRLRNVGANKVDAKMCAANDDMGVFSTSQGSQSPEWSAADKIARAHSGVTRIAPALPGRPAALIALRFRFQGCLSRRRRRRRAIDGRRGEATAIW